MARRCDDSIVFSAASHSLALPAHLPQRQDADRRISTFTQLRSKNDLNVNPVLWPLWEAASSPDPLAPLGGSALALLKALFKKMGICPGRGASWWEKTEVRLYLFGEDLVWWEGAEKGAIGISLGKGIDPREPTRRHFPGWGLKNLTALPPSNWCQQEVQTLAALSIPPRQLLWSPAVALCFFHPPGAGLVSCKAHI